MKRLDFEVKAAVREHLKKHLNRLYADGNHTLANACSLIKKETGAEVTVGILGGMLRGMGKPWRENKPTVAKKPTAERDVAARAVARELVALYVKLDGHDRNVPASLLELANLVPDAVPASSEPLAAAPIATPPSPTFSRSMRAAVEAHRANAGK